MTPPPFDTSSLKAMKRTAQLMLVYVRTLLFIERTVGLPNWIDAVIDAMDKNLSRVEDFLFRYAPPSAALDNLKAQRAAWDEMMRETEPVESDPAPATHGGVLAHAAPSVTAETPSRASGRPSRNDAAHAARKFTRARAPRTHAPYTDHFRTPAPQIDITPRARPPPAPSKTEPPTPPEPCFCGRPCWLKVQTRLIFPAPRPKSLPMPDTLRPSPTLITLGCRLNAYESEVMRGHAAAAGLSDAVIINTCAVTAEAVRTARQAIRRAAKDHPGAPILVTGCAAQIEPETFAAMPQVTRVIGNDEKLKSETWIGALHGAPEKIRVNDIMSVKRTAAHLVDGLEGRARAYVQVQNGCDHRCTFCIIPFGRGNSRSVPAGDVIAQIRRLVETGHHEVVLTGVDLTSWGTDLPGTPPLGNLVQRILKLVPDLKSLRLSSIDAIEMDDALKDAMSEPRVAPYLHLSLQHGDNLILKRMKRRHAREDAIALVQDLRARRPDIAFGADLIAGFPTETDAHHGNSLRLIEDCDLAFLHVFPYSPRQGTPAARMPQLSRAAIKTRAAQLRAAGDIALQKHFMKHIGQTRDALIERGRTARFADFTQVALNDDPSADGQVRRVTITGANAKTLTGAVL